MADNLAQISQNHPDFEIASKANELLGDARIPNPEKPKFLQKLKFREYKQTVPILNTERGTALISGMENETRDPLTGLHNRGYFNKALLEANLVEEGKEFAVIIVDADHFKSINDQYGHQDGDAVLVELARKLQEGFRSIDISGGDSVSDVVVARYGGEEFGIIFRNVSHRVSFNQRIERFRKSIENDIVRTKRNSVSFTASFGIAYGNSKTNPNDVLEKADKALYEAKRTGRNKVIVAE